MCPSQNEGTPESRGSFAMRPVTWIFVAVSLIVVLAWVAARSSEGERHAVEKRESLAAEGSPLQAPSVFARPLPFMKAGGVSHRAAPAPRHVILPDRTEVLELPAMALAAHSMSGLVFDSGPTGSGSLEAIRREYRAAEVLLFELLRDGGVRRPRGSDRGADINLFSVPQNSKSSYSSSDHDLVHVDDHLVTLRESIVRIAVSGR